MKKKEGFTLIELLATIAILAIISMIAMPIVVGVIQNAEDSLRNGKLESYAKEVQKAYMLMITKNKFYAFDSESKGGITTDGVIRFTNAWIDEHASSDTVNCKGTETAYSNVYLNTSTNMVDLKGCIVDGKVEYHYLNGKVVKE